MKQWEYKVVMLSDSCSHSEAYLNGLGAQGWEVVWFSMGAGRCSNQAILKREIPRETPYR